MMVFAVALTAVACNTKPSASGEPPSTSAAKLHIPPSTSVPGASETTTTVPFERQIEDAREQLEKANGNLCGMVEAAQKQLQATPVNATEVHEAIDLLVDMIHAMGRVAAPGDGATFNAAADELRSDATNADYSVTWMQSSASWEAINDKNFVAAASRLESKYQATCRPTTTAPG
jgi:hypothetical protein